MFVVPALKVQQFNQTIYLLNLAAGDVERLVRFEVLGDAAMQGRPTKSRKKKTSLVNWGDIEERIEAKDEAYQRPILKKKIEEIAAYVLESRESGQLPPLPGAVLLTTDEPVTFRGDGTNPFVGLLQFDDEEGALRVLDGQHRLLSLSALLQSPNVDATTAAALKDLQIPAVLFAGLPPAAVVEMFVTINSKHTKLNPSLLLSLSGQKLFADERDARVHDVIKTLNEDEDSALRGDIKMLGVGAGRVAQAGLAQELRRALEDIRRDAGGAEWVDQLEHYAPALYNHYFLAVAKVLAGAWGKDGYSTHSLLALRAFIQASREVFRLVFARGGDPRAAIAEVVMPWAARVGSERFRTAGMWRDRAGGGGKETTRLLTRELIEALAVESEPTR
ncbi:MAG: DGQHR domain-containing protein [Polyangiaceae bacterium]